MVWSYFFACRAAFFASHAARERFSAAFAGAPKCLAVSFTASSLARSSSGSGLAESDIAREFYQGRLEHAPVNVREAFILHTDFTEKPPARIVRRANVVWAAGERVFRFGCSRGRAWEFGATSGKELRPGALRGA